MLAAGAVAGNPASFGVSRDFRRLLPIVDTHQHLVDFNRFGNDWSRPPVPGNYGMAEYKQAIKGLNIVKAVYMEVAVPEKMRYKEALYAMELCSDKSNPTVGAVIAANLYMDDFRGYMTQFKKSPSIKGIRASIKSRESLLDSSITDNIRFLGDMDMRFDFIVPPAWLPDMAKLVRSCPGTKFQADHCCNSDPKAFFDPGKLTGKPDNDRDEWITGVKAIASEKNVVCKISGLVSRLSGFPVTAENIAPVIDHCLSAFGTERVMFASDWPWCLKGATIKDWVETLKQVVINRPYQEQKKLFHDNAIKHYKI